ncbi:DUF2442 domain-containing protein [bacterium]|nr:MAG: DUF2442 domain-containing protein [bacterium]
MLSRQDFHAHHGGSRASVSVVGRASFWPAPWTRLSAPAPDGTVGDADFSGRTWTGVFEPLTDPAYYAQVEVDPETATIAWPDGLDMAPEALDEEARKHPLTVA